MGKFNWLWVARVGKVAALLCFLLPWVVVSCNNQGLLEATGYQLMTGSPKVADQMMVPQPELDGAWWAVTAAAIIVIGLLVAFFVRTRKTAGRLMAISSLFAIIVLAVGMGQSIQKLNGELEEKTAELGKSDNEQARAMASMVGGMFRIDIDIQPGYWLTLASLAIAAGGGLAAGQRRDDKTLAG